MPYPWLPPTAGYAVLILVMAWAWRRQLRTENAGIVDLIWGAAIGALALVYATLLAGWAPRAWLVAGLVGIWSGRLTWHLAQRMGREQEDGRYRQLREEARDGWPAWSFVFFQAQALLAVLLSLVFLQLISADTAEAAGWRTWDFAGLALWLLAQAGEALSDHQLDLWRKDPANRGKSCRKGLWRYSRHPNYFFEWLHWVAYAIMSTGLPGWPFCWIAPAVMLLLVRKVTGIPPTEQQSLKSRPVDYALYQRETNAFFPGPPRRVAP